MEGDAVFKMAAQYAALGWYVLRTYGLLDDEKTCSCRMGRDCGTPGKHPVDGRWQELATTDEDTLADWFDGSRPVNVSVALGEKSGIIDIEWDGEEGRLTAERFNLPAVATPTYQSHRSEHRIFKYDSRLPQQAVFKLGGLEVRIGGGNKGAQSVFPPSLHASGVKYRWKLGCSPDDVPVAEVPEPLMKAILAAAAPAERALKPAASEILHKQAAPGERHHSLVRFAASQCLRMVDPHDPREQQDVLAILRSINTTQCRPPKTDAQVESIYQSELRWAIKVKAAGRTGDAAKEALDAHLAGDPEAEQEAMAPVDSPFTLVGLEFREGEWWPGRWRLKVVHNDPVQYVLSIPVLVGSETKTVDVTMNAEAYRSSAKVACAVLEGTHTVILDAVPEQWSQIWCGSAARPRSGTAAIRGLKAKLMDAASHEDSTAEGLRSAKVAGWFLDALLLTPQPGDDEDDPGEPDAGGRPSWVRAKDGVWELWFNWTRVWEDVDRGRRKLEEGDMQKIKKLVLAFTGEKELADGRHTSDGGSKRRYIRFTARHLKALERITAGELPTAAQLQAAGSAGTAEEMDEIPLGIHAEMARAES
jgi:hypothetical protein